MVARGVKKNPTHEALEFIDQIIAVYEGRSEMTLQGVFELRHHGDPDNWRSVQAMRKRFAESINS